jgi:hypothetical protein
MHYGRIGILAGLIAVSIGAAYLLGTNDLLKGALAVPAVGAMLGILGEVVVQSVRHHFDLDLQRRAQAFDFAFSTRAAEMTFERHLIFAEKYASLVLVAFRVLQTQGTAAGPRENFADRLRCIRDEHAIMLTTEVESQLVEVEKLLRSVESGEIVHKDLPVGAERSALVRETHAALKALIGTPSPGRSADSELHRVLVSLRSLLGIEELTQMRSRAISQFASAPDAKTRPTSSG